MTKQFHFRQFLPLDSLVETKRRSGEIISAVIPTLNEADTIGPIVGTLRRELIEEKPLVDEILVIDGNSTDSTRREAADHGATVHAVDDLLAGQETPRGKGTALWKSLSVSKGSIIVCLDADIINFDSRFVYGVAGALLRDPLLVLAKAHYRRPLVVDQTRLENFGGRVTEILVRPVLSAFFPQLVKIYQPLSGEYAFRKKQMEEIAFSSGYGVEMELLINTWRAYGLERICQVDMETRCHRNRTVEELGKISFGVLQTLLRKLQEERIADIRTAPCTRMTSLGANGWYETIIRDERIAPLRSRHGGE